MSYLLEPPLYRGEAVRIATRVSDVDSQQPVQVVSAVVDLWGPGVDRQTAAPTKAGLAMTWRDDRQDYVLVLDTADGDWPVGRWTYRVRVTGADTSQGTFTALDYSTFVLKP